MCKVAYSFMRNKKLCMGPPRWPNKPLSEDNVKKVQS